MQLGRVVGTMTSTTQASDVSEGAHADRSARNAERQALMASRCWLSTGWGPVEAIGCSSPTTAASCKRSWDQHARPVERDRASRQIEREGGNRQVRIAEVIGRVTLSRSSPQLKGGRFLIALPMPLAALTEGTRRSRRRGRRVRRPGGRPRQPDRAQRGPRGRQSVRQDQDAHRRVLRVPDRSDQRLRLTEFCGIEVSSSALGRSRGAHERQRNRDERMEVSRADVRDRPADLQQGIRRGQRRQYQLCASAKTGCCARRRGSRRAS